MTGEREISADALLEFFAPLEDYLDDLIAKQKITVGWKAWKPPSKREIFPKKKSSKSAALNVSPVYSNICFLQILIFCLLH